MAKDKYPWTENWKSRNKLIASIIRLHKVSSVLDVGGGLCALKPLLDRDVKYVSIDIKKWTDETVVADLNKEFPKLGMFDLVVCQGVLEYMENPISFINGMKSYSNKMILTYRTGNETVIPRNHIERTELETMIKYCGWKIDSVSASVSKFEKVYLCSY